MVDWSLGVNRTNPLNALMQGMEQGNALRVQREDRQLQQDDRAFDRQRLLKQDERQAVVDQRRTVVEGQQDAAFGQQQKQWSQEDQEFFRGSLLNEARALRLTPPEMRVAAFRQRVVPVLQKMGVNPEQIEPHLNDEVLSDAEIDQFEAQMGGGQGQEQRGMVLSPGSQLRDPRTGSLLAQAPFAPQYRAVGEGQSLVELGGGAGGGGGGPMAAPELDFGQLEGAIVQAFPGTRVTSRQRSPADNARVDGVPNSYHLTDKARDFVPPQGMSTAQFAATLKAQLPPGVEVIDEGNHVHIEPAPQRSGSRVVAQGQPKPDNAPAGYAFQPDGSLRFIPGGPADPATVGAKAQQTQMRSDRTYERGLRSDFRNEPDVKNFRDVDASFRQVNALASKPRPTSSDDTALTFSFMKMLDPGSVVREGEFALVGKGAGLSDQVVMALAMVDQGKVLTPTIRANLVKAAETVFQQRKVAYDRTTQEYRRIAGESGVDPESVVKGDEPTSQSGGDFTEAQRATAQRLGVKSDGPVGTRERPYGPRNEAEYKSIPAGKMYIHPDGTLKVKGQ